MQEVGRQALFLGATLTALAAGPAILAARFESEFVKIENLVGESAEALAGMRGDVLALAGDTARSPQELARALFFIESGGLRGQQALDALRLSAQGAAIGLGDTADVGRLLTQALIAFREQGLDAERATNVLTATIRFGNLETAELASTFGRVLPLAASLGVEFSDLGAFVAAYTRVGGSAAEATTSLQAVLVALTRGGTAAQEALADVGLSLEELRRVAREEGLAQALFAILDAVERGGGAAEETLAQIIPNVRALRGVLATAGAQAEDFLAIQEEMRGELDLVAEGMDRLNEDSFFRFQQALAEMQIAAIEFGSAVLPTFVTVTRVAADFVSLFTQLPGPVRAFIGVGTLLSGILLTVAGATAVLVGGLLRVGAGAATASGGLGRFTAAAIAARVASIALISTGVFAAVGLVAALGVGFLGLGNAMGFASDKTSELADEQERLAAALDLVASNTVDSITTQREQIEDLIALIAARIRDAQRQIEQLRPTAAFAGATREGTEAIRQIKQLETGIEDLNEDLVEQQRQLSIVADAEAKLRQVEGLTSQEIRERIEVIEQLNDLLSGEVDLEREAAEALFQRATQLGIANLSEEERLELLGALRRVLGGVVTAEDAVRLALIGQTGEIKENTNAWIENLRAQTAAAAGQQRAAAQVSRAFLAQTPEGRRILEQFSVEQIIRPGELPGTVERDLFDPLTRLPREVLDRISRAADDAEVSAILAETGIGGFLDSLNATTAAAGGAAASLSEVEQALLALADRRERERVAGLIRDLVGATSGVGPGLSDVLNQQRRLDEQFAQIAPIIEERLGVVPILFRELFDQIVGEIEEGAVDAARRGGDFGGLLGLLIARRLAEAPPEAGAGAGLVARPGASGLGVGRGSEFPPITIEQINIGTGATTTPREVAVGIDAGLRASLADQA